uniref:uncharacterized protein LOC118528818 n=1 Tax=Halichoerus grypus TaxID=9711 RepID=UPI001658F722|nr:uncharacterized protein LOC118528818 [Halichoerus grypus]
MDELNQVPEIYITMPPKTFPSACPTPVNAIPMDDTSIVYFMSLSLNDVTLLQNVLKLLLLPPPRAPYAPTQWPSDPKRALEGPQRQAQLRPFRPGRTASAARKSARATGSWRCSALPPTSAAKRAPAPHCAAHSSREQRWGAGPAQNHRKAPHNCARDKPWAPSPGGWSAGRWCFSNWAVAGLQREVSCHLGSIHAASSAKTASPLTSSSQPARPHNATLSTAEVFPCAPPSLASVHLASVFPSRSISSSLDAATIFHDSLTSSSRAKPCVEKRPCEDTSGKATTRKPGKGVFNRTGGQITDIDRKTSKFLLFVEGTFLPGLTKEESGDRSSTSWRSAPEGTSTCLSTPLFTLR